MINTDIGIVVPTLGVRIDYLRSALLSIRNAGNAQILVVAPNDAKLSDFLAKDLYDLLLTDPGEGLSAAIDFGIREFSNKIKFVNWLGDDDLLAADSLDCASKPMRKSDKVVMVYGKCEYIDHLGNKITTNRSGSYAKFLMRFGPQLVSQPGSLIRRSTYLEAGGLNCDYRCAFDLDLFLRLQKSGKLCYVPEKLASFRWHADSLTVRSRSESIAEARAIRISALPNCIRSFAPIWERPISLAIRIAGNYLNHYSRVK